MFWLKAELGRIWGKDNIVKDIRSTWELKKPQLLSALKKSRSKEVHSILSALEDGAAVDEKGW